jgi:hypothetical protein
LAQYAVLPVYLWPIAAIAAVIAVIGLTGRLLLTETREKARDTKGGGGGDGRGHEDLECHRLKML